MSTIFPDEQGYIVDPDNGQEVYLQSVKYARNIDDILDAQEALALPVFLPLKIIGYCQHMIEGALKKHGVEDKDIIHLVQPRGDPKLTNRDTDDTKLHLAILWIRPHLMWKGFEVEIDE